MQGDLLGTELALISLILSRLSLAPSHRINSFDHHDHWGVLARSIRQWLLAATTLVAQRGGTSYEVPVANPFGPTGEGSERTVKGLFIIVPVPGLSLSGLEGN